MSKLQLLAQKRKLETQLGSKNNQNSSDINAIDSKPKESGLSKLISKRKLNETTNNGNQLKGNISAFDSLLAKKKLLNSNHLNIEQKDKLKFIGKKILLSDTQQKKQPSITDNKQENVNTQEPRPQIKENNNIHNLINIPRIESIGSSKLFTKIQQYPSHILPSVLFSCHLEGENIEPESKRRKIVSEETPSNTNITKPLPIPDNLAVKINKNFQSPSPDDKRKVVDSLTDKISQVNLEINEESTEELQPIKKKVAATKPKSKIDVEEELVRKSSKPLLSFIVIGHVDSGKSTTIGRLLYDLAIVDSRTLYKLTKDAELAGKGSFSLAWVMDQTPEERARGVTIDIVQTQFETEDMRFAVIDSPGHRDYVPQMINGVTQADIAVVIIDSTSDLIFEANRQVTSDSSVSEISKGQTFEQLTIAKNLGISKLIVLVNKMDTINWDQDRFETIKSTLENHLTESLNFEKQNLDFIPTSGFKGDNIVNPSKDCKWYKNGSLFEHLQKINKETHQQAVSSDPFVLTVTDINSTFTGNEKKADQIVIHGRVNSGILQPGETIKLWPSEETAQVDSVVTTISQIGSLAKKNGNINSTVRKNEKIASTGEFVELKLRKIDLPESICIGDLATKVNYESVNCTHKLVCELNMFGLTRPVLVGTPFVLFRGNVSYPARLFSIEWVESKSIDENGNIKFKKSKKRKHLSSGQRSKVVIEVEKEIPIVEIDNGTPDSDKLKRIVLRKEGMTVGAGKIKSCE